MRDTVPSGSKALHAVALFLARPRSTNLNDAEIPRTSFCWRLRLSFSRIAAADQGAWHYAYPRLRGICGHGAHADRAGHRQAAIPQVGRNPVAKRVLPGGFQ